MKKFMKRALSLCLSLVMIISCWVFVEPQYAHAASAADYDANVIAAFESYVGAAAGDATIETTYGKYFPADTKTAADAASLYKNVIYSGTAQSVTGVANYDLADEGALESFNVYYPLTVLMYDGVTTPQFGISIRKDAKNNCHIYHWGTAMTATGLELAGNWGGVTTGTSDGQFLDPYSGDKNRGSTNTTSFDTSNYYDGDASQWYWMANLVKYTGSMDNTYSTTITPSFSTHVSQGEGGCDGTGYKGNAVIDLPTVSVPVHVINVKPWNEAVYDAIDVYQKLVGHENEYTAESISNFKSLAKALLDTNPNKISWANNTATAVTNYATNAQAAVNAWKAWGGLVEFHSVTFDNLFDYATFKNNGITHAFNITSTGFSISCASGDETVTNSSVPFAIEGGKTYAIVADISGTTPGCTEMFMFFNDSTGKWCEPNYPDGSGNGAGINSTHSAIGIFKAPAHAVTASLRFDCDGAGNTATYNNIRVYEVDGVQENITVPVPGMQIDGNASLPALSADKLPTRPGYDFAGWFDANGTKYYNADGSVANSTAVNSDLVFNSHWTVSNYKIKFNANGGTCGVSELGYTIDSTALTLPTPTRNGYNFTGWTVETAAGNWTQNEALNSSISKKYGNITVKANWTPITYTITLNENSGNAVDDATYNIESGKIPAAPTRTGHDFAGWIVESTDGNWNIGDKYNPGDNIAGKYGNVTLKASWTISKYTVTWIVDGVTTTQTYEYGSMPNYGSTPTKAADAQYTYTFSGWDKTITNVTEDVTYTAQFSTTVNQYTVTWKDEDGTVLKTETLDYGSTPNPPADPEKAATAQYTYVFAGWSPAVTDVKGDAIYTATYTSTVNKYTVTWKNDDGTVLETDTDVPYGTEPSYDGEEPTKAPTAQYTYTFAGWTPEKDIVTGNITYTAKYTSTVNTYTVIWQNEDGTELEKDENVPYGTMPKYDGATPEKEATAQYTYTFDKWTTEVVAVTGNVTYTAKYTSKVNSYTVTWLNADGTLLKTDTLEYGAIPQYLGKTPEKAATAQYTYTFAGWEPEISTVTDHVTYKATYTSTVNKYTVTWKNEDGTVLETDTDVEFGTMPKYDGATPTKASTVESTFTFEGNWSPAVDTVKGNVTYTAQFTEKPREYTITWDIEGEQETTQVAYGQTPVYNGTPTKDKTAEYSYTFDKWTPDIVEVTGEATYTAIFTQTPNVYNITWIAEVDGVKQTVATTPVAYGTKLNTLTFPDIPVWEGHTGAWVIEYDTMPAEPIEIHVNYVSGSVVTWYVNGEMAYQKAFEGGAQIEYLGAEPTKAKDAQYTYTFEGWSLSADSEEIAVKKDGTFPTAQINSDITYYAVFSKTVNTYTVTWVDDDGTELEKDENVPYGATPSYDKEDPTKAKDAQYTYTFAGWDKPLATVTGDVTFTATYDKTVNEYTITWKNYDGTTLKTDTVPYGETPAYSGATPEKAGNAQYSYTHSGWTPSVVSVTGDATYTATFTESVNKYTITWKNEDGSVLLEENVAYGTVPAYNGTPAKAATAQYTFTFAGWDVTPVAVTGEATYTATYTSTVNKYIVTWANDDGEVIKTEEVEYGTTPSYVGDTPTKAKDAQYTYTFAGWEPEISTVTDHVTYKATYTSTVNKYTVTWVDENGTVLEKDENVPYGATPSYGGENPSKESSATTVYTFAGWDKKVENVTGDVTYTATYTESARKYTVFWMVDGEVYESAEVAYGATVPAPTKPLPQREGYDVSWDKKVTVMPAGTVEINAVFTAKKYPVYWSVDGQIKYTAAVSFGSALPTMIVPEKVGHTGKWVNVPETMPANSLTIIAEYTPNKYSVLWRVDGVQKTDTATYGTNYVLVLETENIPEELRITVGGIILSEENYTYNSETGTLTIYGSAITGNINIVAKSTSGSVNVVINIFGGSSSNTSEVITTRQTYHTTINPSAGYLRPNNVSVYIDGILLTEGYSYDAPSGRLTVNAEIVIGELEIYAECPVDPDYKPSDDNISSDNCSCNCHTKNAFIKFFFDIATFFRRIFGMTQYRYCECGNAHW